MQLTVVSFNLRTAAIPDGANGWPNRQGLALERLRACTPDLIGLQECHAGLQGPFIQSGLPEYHFLGTPRGGAGEAGREISAILYQPAIFELLAQRTFWLSETPELPGSRSWGSAFTRTVEQVILRARRTGQRLAFLNTHFDYVPAATLASAHLLRGALAALDPSLPVLLTGDFNAGKASQAYAVLTGGGRLNDALRLAGHAGVPAAEGTFHDFGRATTPQPIDWILASPHFTVVQAGVDRSHTDGRYASDHYPVWAVLELAE